MSRTSPAEVAAQRRAEEEARFKALYGDALPHVRTLQRRGFVVTKEGKHFLVGNKRLTKAELVEMAEREASVAGMADPGRRVVTTASGLRVGQAVALTPKKAPVATTSAKPRALSGAAATAKAKAAEHSTDLGARPRVVWLDLGLLTIDNRYQRDINDNGAAHINRILKAFNWNCYQPIIVTENADGTYPVIDGQHRLEAAKKHPLIDSLPCYIIDAPNVAAQAAIFVAVNSVRRALTSQQKFFAALAAGNESAVAVDKACRDAGVTILRTPPSYDIPPRSVLAPFTLEKLLVRPGRIPLATALKLLAETHPETKNAFRSPTIAALTRIVTSREFSRSRMAETLRKTDLDWLYNEARAQRITVGGTLETATERVLKRLYDSEGRAAA